MGNPGGQEPGNELFAAVSRPISGCCTGPAAARYLSLMLHLSLCSGRLDTGLRPHLYIPFMELINGFLAPWFSGSR